ncbi:MAG: TetR/AcrR family transcriptional regulator, partial [Deltaproteobacteria bacterium]|nr:TetR/AcrR family transcriptional regulator [Deltaproteobacteria bacterium]
MSKREKKKADNRLRLIHSAAESFAAQGIKGANINLISVGAGLGKGTVYNYFPSKRELFLAVLDWAGQQLRTRLEEPLTEPAETVPKLKALVKALLSFYQSQTDLAKMLIRTVSAHQVEYQQALVAAYNPLLAGFQEALAAGIDKGQLRPDLDPFLSAMTLWGMVNHQAAFHWLVSSRPLDPEGLAELVMAYFLSG